jgi:hypothetical protein
MIFSGNAGDKGLISFAGENVEGERMVGPQADETAR